MTYAEAIQFLYGLQLFGTHFGLERTRQLAALAGNPQDKLRFIHVAGTNGKGSTCAMLESIYRAAGLRVGLFTSPHLVSFRERMQVNRQLVAEADITRLVAEVQPLLQQFPTEAHPTMFEVVAVMALKYFTEQQCDLVIWETGLGGRLDATNIVTPLASVITDIALDHQQWLGDTLAEIAAEKAGIIKPGVPIVTAAAEPEVMRVLEEVANKNHSPFTRIDVRPSAISHQPSSLLGDHQKRNAALALATVEILQQQIPVGEATICKGLADTTWPGRLQLITRPGGQKILLDGAHNLAGAEALRGALAKHFAGVRPVVIFGALADKNWLEICRLLAPLAEKVFTVPVASGRSAGAGDLAAAFRTANSATSVTAAENLSDALNACENKPFVVITGSLYLIGEALERLGFSPADTDERGLNEWSTPKITR